MSPVVLSTGAENEQLKSALDERDAKLVERDAKTQALRAQVITQREEIKALKKELRAVKKEIKTLRAEFVERLNEARDTLSAEHCQQLVLDIAKDDLATQLKRYVTSHRRRVIAVVQIWWDKYKVTKPEIEQGRLAAAEKLDSMLSDLGYAKRSS